MKNTTKIILILIGIMTMLISCEKENETAKTYKISGIAQKGPYIVGANITISELNSDLTPTGKNYYTTIIDNFGTFEIPDVELSSNYVKIIADGNYFHEISGSIVPYRLTLTSIANLKDSTTININILTNLETDRLQYLVNNSGMDFNEAKSKAQSDVLSIFNLDSDNHINSEYMDLTKTGDDNSKLLAISSIIQGNRTISELTEILSNIKTDIKENGILDDNEIQTDLRSRAEFLKFNSIEENLKSHFNLNSISDFQKSINYFLDNSEFETTNKLEIPINTESGTNLLSLATNTILKSESMFCVATNVICSESLLYNVQIKKEKTLNWEFSSNGWDLTLEGDSIMNCNLIEQDNLSIIPIELFGNGKLELTIDIGTDQAGWSHSVKEFIVE